MEVIRRRRVGHAPVERVTPSTQLTIPDQPADGEGRLCLTLGDGGHIVILGVRIYLNDIKQTGGKNRAVRLIFIGPKTIPIERVAHES